MNVSRENELLLQPQHLFTAICLGFSWSSPVLQELVKQFPGALNSLDEMEKLPPFLLAATVPRACLIDIYQHESDREPIATTIYELLRSQPTALSNLMEDNRGRTDLRNSQPSSKNLPTRDDTNTAPLESSGTKRKFECN